MLGKRTDSDTVNVPKRTPITAFPSPPPPDEQTNDGRQKPRRTERWLLAVGALILFGLLLNQQLASRRTSVNDEVERLQPESATAPAPEAPASAARRRNAGGDRKPSATPMRVVYTVTHRHRLRDCHGRLTFTRKGLRFDSDEPEDSFDVALDEVTIEGDVVRIRNKPWRFQFNDGVRVDRLFTNWKAGRTLQTPKLAP